jgi:hypothetical protein
MCMQQSKSLQEKPIMIRRAYKMFNMRHTFFAYDIAYGFNIRFRVRLARTIFAYYFRIWFLIRLSRPVFAYDFAYVIRIWFRIRLLRTFSHTAFAYVFAYGLSHTVFTLIFPVFTGTRCGTFGSAFFTEILSAGMPLRLSRVLFCYEKAFFSLPKILWWYKLDFSHFSRGCCKVEFSYFRGLLWSGI